MIFSDFPLVQESAVTCQLPLKMAQEIEIQRHVTSTLTLDRQPLPTNQISLESEKLFVDGRTYGQTSTIEAGFIRSNAYGIYRGNKSQVVGRTQVRTK